MLELYKKYRPTTLDTIVGQGPTLVQLKGYLPDKIPHVLGFFGAPGTGKTTLARIIAGLAGANWINVIEKNMGQFNGIDDIRAMQEACQFRPLGGGSTVYILDEFHSISKQAAQGLLKLFEDTPKHVYFIVCTSQPEKIDKAIKTRIAGFNLSELSVAMITKHLGEVLVAELGASTAESAQAIDKIAKAANGSMRTALVMLEQVIASGFDTEVVEALKSDEDNFDSKPDLRDLCQALLFKKGTWSTVYQIADRIKDDEIESARWYILAYAKSCLSNARSAPMAARCILEMREPFFNSKKAGFLAVCYKLFVSPSV